jgi:hypothetical protein
MRHQTWGASERALGIRLGCVEVDYPSANVDGFELGMFVSCDDCGDAWVKAFDGSVATLIWETGEPRYFNVSIEPDRARWGHLRRATSTADEE